ncbi:uncharacterized protein LOC107435682 isoform X1 [Ziziphus jujuba]|uniref:Uncharacterized protein LOC107435682 isoform X1 n=2 Tax=Ziziphus jujuba TaxID=326968 RepID=A0A6P4BIB6_ZIZJJ|nr:uncharacterized protein LOC107435682 isoform X1 [Ziziphus jujuba]
MIICENLSRLTNTEMTKMMNHLVSSTDNMQREREREDDFFHSDEPLASFDGFGGFGSRSMFSSPFGGRDPFNDPFFSRPFGTASSHTHTMETGTEKGIVIEELNSDEEELEQEDRGQAPGDEKIYSRKYSGSSKEPSVEHPDDVGDAERKSKNVTSQNEPNKAKGEQHQNRSYSFCKVTYGGVDGAYYTSTRTRRGGGDGMIVEETKEADKTTCQATHKISRGIHDKGHSVTRKLKSDGKVDTLQTLHNLNEDELAGFEDAWNCNVEGQLPGWKAGSGTHDFAGSSSSEHRGGTSWGSWLLPATKQAEKTRGAGAEDQARTSGGGIGKKVVRINIE